MGIRGSYRAMVVLGASVRDGEPGRILALRIEAAARMYRRGLARRVVLCGGKAEETGVSEARVMARCLGALGVPAEAIWLEERSWDTAENLTNARAVLRGLGVGDGERVLIVTSDYHAARAMHLARHCGMTADVARVRTPGLAWAMGMGREGLGWVKHWMGITGKVGFGLGRVQKRDLWDAK